MYEQKVYQVSPSSGGSIGGRWGRSPPYGVEIIFFHSGVFAKIVVFLQKLNNYPLHLFLLVFLVQWYLILRLQLSLLCSKASIKPPLLLEASFQLSCNVVNPHFFNFSTSMVQILES